MQMLETDNPPVVMIEPVISLGCEQEKTRLVICKQLGIREIVEGGAGRRASLKFVKV